MAGAGADDLDSMLEELGREAATPALGILQDRTRSLEDRLEALVDLAQQSDEDDLQAFVEGLLEVAHEVLSERERSRFGRDGRLVEDATWTGMTVAERARFLGKRLAVALGPGTSPRHTTHDAEGAGNVGGNGHGSFRSRPGVNKLHRDRDGGRRDRRDDEEPDVTSRMGTLRRDEEGED